jgi:VanZ family protein
MLIFIQSSYPAPKSLPDFFSFDKILHFFAYAILGALFLRAFMTTRMKNKLTLLIILSILLSSLYGISDEIHQHFVPYRNADLLDALMDVVGSVFGVYAYQAVEARYRTYFHE